ncbi:hypothetical protein P691DRAFT_478479 [Macrolepiota fuliginosa MF-IS2]|uniref:Orc1-like AAA ATPase domain-containing protein n=1 Tax=Macrolepiota fuliginosa MF-IS2 TaxID=1400762 RepID=A0A9P5X320_9AGAR|nr:hypothetical protein P691DRAFT_478479 [Macrolepiota fuliginosa MF-IS2]
MGTNSLEKMLPHIISRAEFNSIARDPPPTCHPNTRTRTNADLQNRINGTVRRIWIHGPAGVGKSAIMQDSFDLCGVVFFTL